MNNTTPSRTKKLVAGLALIAITGALVAAIVVLPQTQSADMTASMTSSAPADNTMYKDGMYTATGSYTSPGGKESLSVNLTIAGNVVTVAEVTQGANDPTAVSYQRLFINNYKSYVVGKKINSLNLSNVAGSSLTPKGFNDALKQIESQAKMG